MNKILGNSINIVHHQLIKIKQSIRKYHKDNYSEIKAVNDFSKKLGSPCQNIIYYNLVKRIIDDDCNENLERGNIYLGNVNYNTDGSLDDFMNQIEDDINNMDWELIKNKVEKFVLKYLRSYLKGYKVELTDNDKDILSGYELAIKMNSEITIQNLLGD